MDVYRKTGRGGAGNFYSQKDIEEATKAARSDDIEAQHPPRGAASPPPSDPALAAQPPSTITPAPVPGQQAYSIQRAGRGGAGNMVDPATQPSLPTTEEPAAAASSAHISSTSAPPPRARAGLSGRGGAGNWNTDEATKAAQAEQERKRQAAIEAKVLEDIKMGLPEPPRTYHLHGGKEKVGEPQP